MKFFFNTMSDSGQKVSITIVEAFFNGVVCADVKRKNNVKIEKVNDRKPVKRINC